MARCLASPRAVFTKRCTYSAEATEANHSAALIDVKGLLYGTTAMGGANNVGTVFSITTDGNETVVHSFGAGGGENPRAGLLQVGNTLYGTTYGAQNNGHGNVFAFKP